ncbi:MAG: hypothetical protein IT187_08325, partial [Geothrix sp.]|nr:hypothetical protein [Geothrix sp.]
MATEPNLPKSSDLPLHPAMPQQPRTVQTPEHRTLIRRWFDFLLPHKGWVFALSLAWGLAGVLTFTQLKRDL